MFIEQETGGLWGLCHMRDSFVYRFEVLRLRAGRSALRRAAPLAVGALPFAASAFYLSFGNAAFSGFGNPNFAATIAAVGLLCAPPLFTLVIACAAATRLFASERADGTMDALLMAPAPRYELVAGRLAAWLRPYLMLALAFIVTSPLLFPLFEPAYFMDLFTCLFIWCAASLVYVSVLVLGAGLGLYFGLRLRSGLAAMAASLAALLALVAVDAAIFLLGMAVLSPFVAGATALSRITGYNEAFVAFLGLCVGCAVAALNVRQASRLINRVAMRLDTWATSG